jgi:hypothetical protein
MARPRSETCSAVLRARAMMGVAMTLVLTLGYARYMCYAIYTKAKD